MDFRSVLIRVLLQQKLHPCTSRPTSTGELRDVRNSEKANNDMQEMLAQLMKVMAENKQDSDGLD